MSRSKDGVILSVNEEISGDRKKYQIINRYDLMVKTIDDSDTGRYLCQNFDQVMSMNIELTVLSKSTSEGRKSDPSTFSVVNEMRRGGRHRDHLYLDTDIHTAIRTICIIVRSISTLN